MILYEVNIELLDLSIEKPYLEWLKKHVAEILTLPGFTHAHIFREELPEKITVHYYLDSEKNLENYYQKHAPRLREDGKKRFPDQFKADRRVLTEFI